MRKRVLFLLTPGRLSCHHSIAKCQVSSSAARCMSQLAGRMRQIGADFDADDNKDRLYPQNLQSRYSLRSAGTPLERGGLSHKEGAHICHQPCAPPTRPYRTTGVSGAHVNPQCNSVCCCFKIAAAAAAAAGKLRLPPPLLLLLQNYGRCC